MEVRACEEKHVFLSFLHSLFLSFSFLFVGKASLELALDARWPQAHGPSASSSRVQVLGLCVGTTTLALPLLLIGRIRTFTFYLCLFLVYIIYQHS